MVKIFDYFEMNKLWHYVRISSYHNLVIYLKLYLLYTLKGIDFKNINNFFNVMYIL